MKSNRTAKIPTGVSVIIGFGDEDLSGLEWNIGEWSEGVMYIYLSDKGSKDFIERLGEVKNFFLFTRDIGGRLEEGEEDYYDKDNDVYYEFGREYRREEEPNGNIRLNIDPDYQEHWEQDDVENGYDLILKQYLGLDKKFINWNTNPFETK